MKDINIDLELVLEFLVYVIIALPWTMMITIPIAHFILNRINQRD